MYKHYQKLEENGRFIVRGQGIPYNIHFDDRVRHADKSHLVNSSEDSFNFMENSLDGGVNVGTSLLDDDKSDVIFVKERTNPEITMNNERENILEVYSKKIANNIKQWEEYNKSLDMEVKKVEEEEKSQKGKVYQTIEICTETNGIN